MTVCLYSYLSYPARKPQFFSAVFYRHLWPDSLHHIFLTSSHSNIVFWGKKKTYCTSNVCFDFLYKFCLRNYSF